MNELHLDLFPIIFDYLTQNELLDMLLLSDTLYRQIMKYINNTKFTKLRFAKDAFEKAKKNYVISVFQSQFSEKKYSIEILNGACCNGNMRLFNYALKHVKKFYEHMSNSVFELGLNYACEAKNWKMINKMIELGASNWRFALCGACRGGDLSIVKMLMIKNGNNPIDPTELCHSKDRLYYACKFRHKDIIEYLIENGDVCNEQHLFAACQSGNISIVKLILGKYIIDNPYNSYWCSYYACKSGNVEMVKFICNTVITDFKLHIGITGACKSGNVEILKYLVEQYKELILNLNHSRISLLHEACYGGNMDCINYAIECGSHNWNSGFGGACQGSKNYLFPFLYEKGATKCETCEMTMEEHLEWYRKVCLSDDILDNDVDDIFDNVDEIPTANLCQEITENYNNIIL